MTEEVLAARSNHKFMPNRVAKRDVQTNHVHVPRGMEKLPLLPVVRMLDAVSRRGPFASMASVHFCLFQKPA